MHTGLNDGKMFSSTIRVVYFSIFPSTEFIAGSVLKLPDKSKEIKTIDCSERKAKRIRMSFEIFLSACD